MGAGGAGVGKGGMSVAGGMGEGERFVGLLEGGGKEQWVGLDLGGIVKSGDWMSGGGGFAWLARVQTFIDF